MMGAAMSLPKRIEDVTVEDLSQHRWCYFYDDDGEYDPFEWVIPETHPKFNEEVVQLELATFRFESGQELQGMFDGSKCFSVFLNGDWYALWYGVRIPIEQDIGKLKMVLCELGLQLPVNATAKWSGKAEIYSGIRYYDKTRNEVEA
jgi:hypothetical protein